MRLFYFRVCFLFLLCFVMIACQQKPTSLEGYVDADYTYISSNFSGNLIELFAKRGSQVEMGQALFELDTQPEKAELTNAQANVDHATEQIKQKQIELDFNKNLFERYQKLLKTNGVSREEFDAIQNKYLNAEANLKLGEANKLATEATLERARWAYQNKIIASPIAGIVYDTYYTKGELVAATHPILSLVSPRNKKIVFYSPETLLNHFPLNKEVMIKCDDCRTPIQVTISYVSPQAEYTPPVIFSEKARTKLIYRIEAKSTDSQFLQLHLGQPITVRVP